MSETTNTTLEEKKPIPTPAPEPTPTLNTTQESTPSTEFKPTPFIHYNKLNLRKIKYDIEILEENVDYINMKACVNTQKLTAEFCVKYVLNEDYMSCIEDTYCINYGYVLQRQPHLTKEDIFREYAKINDGKGYSHGI